MPHEKFVHLRVHSAYSLSEGAIKVKKLVELAKKNSMPAVAITDTGNLFGALEFSAAAVEAGVQPVVGCNLGIRCQQDGGVTRTGRNPEPDRLLFLVQDEKGWANLSKLSSQAYLETPGGETPQVSLETVEAHAEGLLCLLGGPSGPVGRLLLEGQRDAAEAVLGRLEKAFAGRLYVELMRTGLPEQARIEGALVDIAYARGLPLVATNDVYFIDESMSQAHDALLCIASGRFLADEERRRSSPEWRFKGAGEMRELFADLPEAVANTLVVARRCSWWMTGRKPILPRSTRAKDSSEADALRELARAGLEKRLAGKTEAEKEPYRKRLEYEADVIVSMGFPGYFLIVADFIQWAKNHGIPVGPGRGSGAGSVVAWALTITDLDPLQFGLLFERFLNPERVSMPDFDIDFCQDRRDEVIKYVQGAYGFDRVAQIITFGKLQARAVLRDVGRVLGMPYGQVDRICKLVPNNPANPVTLQQAIDGEPALKDMIRQDEAVNRLVDIALHLEGLYRHASTHAAGVVIGDRPLEELVPLYRDPRSNMPVTQFNMKDVEKAGLVKFDFLGLKTLTVLSRAVGLIAGKGVAVDVAHLPLDDRKTYEMLSRGDTGGVFQLESTGMRDAVRRLRPDRIEDIIALVALYRPGPMENIPKYIAVKQGAEKPDYLHPSLEGILKETYGVIIYQEQVMQIAQVLSGYSLGGADLLRRAMGKKIKEEMEAQRKTFVEGAVGKGVEQAKASQIFDLVDKFAGYGFNKSHAAAYAIVAYQTAWLKANHPVEFFAASMTLDMSNTDKLNLFRQEVDRLGYKTLPPDINRSDAVFGVEYPDGPEGKGCVRYALAAVRNVGIAAMEALVAERKANGPFRSLFDFARRVDARQVNKRQLENLAKAGAFDALEPNRARVLAAIETILRLAQATAEERSTNQMNIFGGPSGGKVADPPLPQVADMKLHERLQAEFESVGFYLTAHPLDAYAIGLKRLGVVRSADVARTLSAGGSSRVKLAGTVLSSKERTSAKGNRFAFVQLSDAGGTFEVMLFSELLAKSRELLGSNRPLLVSADARVEEENIKLLASDIRPLDEAVAQSASGLRVTLGDAGALAGLKATIAKAQRGRGAIRIQLQTAPGEEVDVRLKESYAITPEMRRSLGDVPGILEVVEI
ncbi:MAG: DNA polymerase III subunit alpha [Rhodospirillales bacterium]|nr:DNA polymerase III subunit alpha [Rhodospirillales bacterium]